MKKFYLAMIVDEYVLPFLEPLNSSIIYIGEPIEITDEDLNKIAKNMKE